MTSFTYRNINIHIYDNGDINASYMYKKLVIPITRRLGYFLDGEYPTEELLDMFIFEHELKTGRKID